MAGITLTQAQAQLDAALVALQKARDAQQYHIYGSAGGGRLFTRAELQQLEADVEKWERRVTQLTRGGIRVRRGVAI
jgi:chromosome segregation and condensation protein ScpB